MSLNLVYYINKAYSLLQTTSYAFFTFLYRASSTFNDILRELVKENGGRNVQVTVGSAEAQEEYRVGFVVFCLLVLTQKTLSSE